MWVGWSRSGFKAEGLEDVPGTPEYSSHKPVLGQRSTEELIFNESCKLLFMLMW